MTASAFICIVTSPRASAEFYKQRLGRQPVYEADNFVQFNVRNDLDLGQAFVVSDLDGYRVRFIEEFETE